MFVVDLKPLRYHQRMLGITVEYSAQIHVEGIKVQGGLIAGSTNQANFIVTLVGNYFANRGTPWTGYALVNCDNAKMAKLFSHFTQELQQLIMSRHRAVAKFNALPNV